MFIIRKCIITIKHANVSEYKIHPKLFNKKPHYWFTNLQT